LYAAARPTYPPALFAWIAERSPGRTLAWDAGCGNGQASVALAQHFHRVHAGDPSAEQIRLAAPDPRVTYRVEPAESSSLVDASVDLITVAQAYHWFDHHRFAAEAHRVTRPGGALAVFNYARSTVTPPVDQIFNELHDTILGSDWPPERQHVVETFHTLPFPFPEHETPEFDMCCTWSLHRYLAYLRSWSASRRHLQRTGRDAVEAMTPDMTAAWGDPDQELPVRWPLMLRFGCKPR